MFLPVINQKCVCVLPNGTTHLGRVSGYGPDHYGRYRIKVWSHSWGYDQSFKPVDVQLMPIVFADGGKWEAWSKFRKFYTEDQIAAMEQAELDHPDVEGKLVPVTSAPPPPPPARIVKDDGGLSDAVDKVVRVVRRTVNRTAK